MLIIYLIVLILEEANPCQNPPILSHVLLISLVAVTLGHGCGRSPGWWHRERWQEQTTTSWSHLNITLRWRGSWWDWGGHLHPGSCQLVSDEDILDMQSTLETCVSQFPWGRVVVRNIPSFASGNSVWDEEVMDSSPAFQVQAPISFHVTCWLRGDFLGWISTAWDVRIADIIPPSLDLPFASPCYPSRRGSSVRSEFMPSPPPSFWKVVNMKLPSREAPESLTWLLYIAARSVWN